MKILYNCLVGSRLYNLATEKSDHDYRGFGMPDISYIIGLKRQETDSSKNLIEKKEGTVYSVSKYLYDCYRGNPTIFEFVFAGDEFVVERTELGDRIAKFVRENMVSKHLFAPYSAYFRAQQKDVNAFKTKGDRVEMIAKYGYDIKAASHTYRIGVQCIEFMKTGWLNPTMSGEDREIAFDIKMGNWKLNDVNLLLTGLDKQMYDAYKFSSLPHEVDFKKVDNFCQEIYSDYVREEKGK